MYNNKRVAWLLFAWIVASIILVFTVIGMLLFVPGINNSQYYIPTRERRSTWAKIGMNLLNQVVK